MDEQIMINAPKLYENSNQNYGNPNQGYGNQAYGNQKPNYGNTGNYANQNNQIDKALYSDINQ